MRYPRNMQGYGGNPPAADWPGGAHVAVSSSSTTRRAARTASCTATPPPRPSSPRSPAPQPWPGQRHWNMESIYEYGARAGFWRLRDLFISRERPGHRLRRRHRPRPLPRPGRRDAGRRLGDRQPRPEVDRLPRPHPRGRARRHRARPSASTPRSPARPRAAGTPAAPRSTPSTSSPSPAPSTGSPTPTTTTSPTGASTAGRQQLIIPYTLDSQRHALLGRHASTPPSDFFTYLRDTFDTLYAEGEAGAPKMMSVGLHCRLVGRPGRVAGLAGFIDYVQSRERPGSPPAATSPPTGAPATRRPPTADRPTTLDRDAFVARFGAIYEHSPWIAERAHALELGPAHDTARRPRQRARPRLPLRLRGRAPRRAHRPPRPRRQARRRQAPDRRDRPPSRPAPASTP